MFFRKTTTTPTPSNDNVKGNQELWEQINAINARVTSLTSNVERLEDHYLSLRNRMNRNREADTEEAKDLNTPLNPFKLR